MHCVKTFTVYIILTYDNKWCTYVKYINKFHAYDKGIVVGYFNMFYFLTDYGFMPIVFIALSNTRWELLLIAETALT